MTIYIKSYTIRMRMSTSNSKPGSFCFFKYENTYPKGRALMQMYRVVLQTNRGWKSQRVFVGTWFMCEVAIDIENFFRNTTWLIDLLNDTECCRKGMEPTSPFKENCVTVHMTQLEGRWGEGGMINSCLMVWIIYEEHKVWSWLNYMI